MLRHTHATQLVRSGIAIEVVAEHAKDTWEAARLGVAARRGRNTARARRSSGGPGSAWPRATPSPPSTPVPSLVPSVQRASPATLRQRLDDAKDEVARLRAENTVLRDQLVRRLGEQRVRG